MKALSTNREKGATIYESLSDYVVIDLETTDVYVTTCSVIELSAIRVRNNEICETFSTLVNPEEKIPEDVTQLTGITDSMVKDAPTLKECLLRDCSGKRFRMIVWIPYITPDVAN